MPDYTTQVGPEQSVASKADLRDAEQYWMHRIREMEDEFRRHRQMTEARIHKLENQLDAMRQRWPGGWADA